MLLPHGAIIALTDGKNFELFRNTGSIAAPELTSLPAPSLEGTNKSAGVHHRSSTGNPDEKRLEEDAHAATVADWLNGQILGHKIETLVVIADPRTLGEMRKHYHKQLESALLGELAKDLTGRPGPDILAALRGL